MPFRAEHFGGDMMTQRTKQPLNPNPAVIVNGDGGKSQLHSLSYVSNPKSERSRSRRSANFNLFFPLLYSKNNSLSYVSDPKSERSLASKDLTISPLELESPKKRNALSDVSDPKSERSRSNRAENLDSCETSGYKSLDIKDLPNSPLPSKLELVKMRNALSYVSDPKSERSCSSSSGYSDSCESLDEESLDIKDLTISPLELESPKMCNALSYASDPKSERTYSSSSGNSDSWETSDDESLEFTHDRVCKMLENSTERTSGSHISFGQFCQLTNDFKKSYGSPKSNHTSRTQEKDVLPHRPVLNNTTRCDVFLGGSCNPTTWRQEFAIPWLIRQNISFYNPQVSHWRPELLETEHLAKENAKVLLFVVDNLTRSVSALIEAAQLSAEHRQLALVIQSYTVKKQTINGEPLSNREFADLKEGQIVLEKLVKRQGYPVFRNLSQALTCIERVLRNNVNSWDCKSDDGTRHGYPEVQKAFDAMANGIKELSVEDAQLAVSALLGRKVSHDEINYAISQIRIGNRMDVSTFRFRPDEFMLLVQIVSESPAPSVPGIHLRNRDVFFGGSPDEGAEESWRDLVVIPHLRSKNMSFYDSRNWLSHDMLMAAAIDDSEVLLFHINNSSRSIVAMAVAAHCIGSKRQVVLCIQLLADNAVVAGEGLTQIAIKDYNRARMYLGDLARRANVPVFSNIKEAVHHATDLVVASRNKYTCYSYDDRLFNS